MKPTEKPANPHFSSGPCSKRPGWSLDALKGAALGRSHRASAGKKKLQEVLSLSREILGIPDDYKLGIVPGSDTGAVEMALWSLLGARGVEVLAWRASARAGRRMRRKQLKIADPQGHRSGLRRPAGPRRGRLEARRRLHLERHHFRRTRADADWIPDDREGLAICDATSAVFAMDVPFARLDVVTWSWQKVLGGEAAHGMLALSPRAVARLESHKPAWPLPKVFQMTKDGKLIEGIFLGDTINTPSMLCVEDAIDGLKWAKSIGGPQGARRPRRHQPRRARRVGARTPVDRFPLRNGGCALDHLRLLQFTDVWFQSLPADSQAKTIKDFTSLLEKEQVAYDIGAYRDAPAGLRIWCGGHRRGDGP